jgi:hypothetical protein
MFSFVRILDENEMENDWEMGPQLTCTQGRHLLQSFICTVIQ